MSGYQFVYSFLRMYGWNNSECEQRANAALQMVGLQDAASRPVAAYSKGMRQRARLAQATAHDPQVVILDEPLNGLDPLARAEAISLFQQWGEKGRHVIVSSHILHEVDTISDQVILLSNGYVVAEGQIRGVREEMSEHPMQVIIRCTRANVLASRVFEQDHVVEVRLHADGGGLLVKTRDADRFYRALNHLALDGVGIESVAPADDNVNSLYEYLIGGEESTR